jgi:hypothetical protein
MYSNNIQVLIENFQHEHTSGQWMLFTASSKVNLKAKLLHTGKEVTSNPLVPADHMTKMHNHRQGFWKKYALKNTSGLHLLT